MPGAVRPSSRKSNSRPASSRPSIPPRAPGSAPPEVVDPRWILSAVVLILALGLLCAYVTLSALFYYGQWQLVLHPSRDLPANPSSLGLHFTELHFDVDPTGRPQLDGWWIPSQLASDPTVLLLHDGSGSMANALPDAQLLHNARLNVLLFDYRGFGHSAGGHPTQLSMQDDARAALAYLTSTRGLPVSSLIVYGRGLGASLATLLCAEHPTLEALILNSPAGDLRTRIARSDPRSHLVPFNLLFHEDFPLADRLHSLRTPKLLITFLPPSTTAPPPLDLQRAGDPKTTVEIAPSDYAGLAHALRRFLDSFVVRIPAELKPAPASAR